MPTRLRLATAIATVWWNLYALMFAIEVMALGQQQGIVVSWQEAAAFSFGGWLTWIPFSVGLYLATAHFPIERGRIFRSVAFLTLAVLTVVVLKAIYVYATNPLFSWYPALPDFTTVLADSLKMNFLMGWAVVAVSHALLFYHRIREREVKVAELEAGLAQARLQAIRAQLNPHFMFNALNSVSEMVHHDANAAESMLLSLSRLLRDGLSDSQRQERSLAEEIALAKDYLMIEFHRLGDRLTVDWRINDACMPAMMPVLTLQPLVENAIIHSIARSRTPGWLRITAEAANGRLRVSVDNSRAAVETERGTGLGLDSIRTRLGILHGDRASFTTNQSDPAIFSARLDLPLSIMTSTAT